MVDTSASPSGAAVMSTTNERSIFSVSTGSLDKIAERGEAGAEVVDGYADAHGANRLQAGDTVLDVLHDDAFGDLQFQSGRRLCVDARLLR